VTSLDLGKKGFSGWGAFTPPNEKALLASLPSARGVYAIRRKTPYQRVRGESDITYIGSATNQDGLRMRVRQYFHPGWKQETNKRILGLIQNSAEFEISWLLAGSAGAAKALEQDLLDKYADDHGELPPENRRR
jgi:excinuclease UvrABC nuclease subunit